LRFSGGDVAAGQLFVFEEKIMTTLSPRENYLSALRHETTEYVPCGWGFDAALCGMLLPLETGNETSGFRDAFGVRWVVNHAAAGGNIPAPGEFLLKDITQWRKDVAIPDVDKYDWQKFADTEYAVFKIDRNKQAVDFHGGGGIWLRLTILMGFEAAMIAMMEEPEACNEFFAAITDYKIQMAEKAAKYYRADTYVNFDDIATERNLFMSPETYRTLIKPHHKRLNEAVRNLGMIPIQHTCGHAEICVEDYIETGAEAWNAVQPSNDIQGLLNKYGERFCLEGGFDTNGRPGQPGATVEEVIAEVERCFREYGGKKGYIFLAGLVGTGDGGDIAEKTAAIAETVNRLRFAGK
jgi:hypothetical protein